MEDLCEKFIGMFIFLTIAVNLWDKFDNVKDYVFAIELENKKNNIFKKMIGNKLNRKKKEKNENNVNNKIKIIKEVNETENEIENKGNVSEKLDDDNTNNDVNKTK